MISFNRPATALLILFAIALAIAVAMPTIVAHGQDKAAARTEQSKIDVYQLTVQAKDLPALVVDQPF